MTNYKDPNLGWKEFTEGALTCPWDVEQNPALPLLSLEDPARYAQLQVEIAEGWRNAGMLLLSAKAQRLYACDCAERVLYLFEIVYPDDTRPRTAIVTARCFAFGLASLAELATARVAAQLVVNMSWADMHRGAGAGQAAVWAGGAAMDTASVTDDAARIAAYAAVEAAARVSEDSRQIEKCWQAECVRHYWRMEQKPLPPEDKINTIPSASILALLQKGDDDGYIKL